MKTVLLCLVMFCSTCVFAGEGKPVTTISRPTFDTTVLTQILALPLQNYIGKPVDSLFNVLPSGYTSRNFMVVKIGKSVGVYQSYFTTTSNSVDIEIYVDNFQYLSFPNVSKTTTWSMSLAGKETIAFIRIKTANGASCVYGCNNANYNYY